MHLKNEKNSAIEVPAETLVDETLVSVIMPAFNAERFIKQSIDSVIAQIYTNWELMVIDDGSTDSTHKIVSELMKNDPRIKLYESGGRKGAAFSRNIGIKNAVGRYIAFLDSDDVWFPGKLSKQIDLMLGYNCVLCYSSYKKMNEQGIIGSGVVRVPKTTTYDELLKSNIIGCLTAVYDVKFFGKVYMPDVKLRQDYGLWLRLTKKLIHEDYRFFWGMTKLVDRGGIVSGIEEPLAVYREYSTSSSANKLKAAASQWYIYRRIEQLGLLKSSYYFVHYAIRGIAKYKIK